MAFARVAAGLVALLALVPRAAWAEEPEPPPPVDTVPADTPAPSETPAEAPATIQTEPATGPFDQPAPGSPSDLSTNETGKRIGVGVDAVLLFPLAEYGELGGPAGGPIVRFGFRVVPRLEIALRAGYLYGSKRFRNGLETKVDILPLWVGARFFPWEPFKGPYVALEGGMNSLLPELDPAPTTATQARFENLRRRFGGNLGIGWLFSEKLPIDARLEVMLLNLIGRDDDLNEGLNVAVSLSAGYTLQF